MLAYLFFFITCFITLTKLDYPSPYTSIDTHLPVRFEDSIECIMDFKFLKNSTEPRWKLACDGAKPPADHLGRNDCPSCSDGNKLYSPITATRIPQLVREHLKLPLSQQSVPLIITDQSQCQHGSNLASTQRQSLRSLEQLHQVVERNVRRLVIRCVGRCREMTRWWIGQHHGVAAEFIVEILASWRISA